MIYLGNGGRLIYLLERIPNKVSIMEFVIFVNHFSWEIIR